jgi:hypothetical protein
VNDFFAHLAERVLAAAAPVRPRLPSLFEDAPRGPSTPAKPAHDFELELETESVPEPRPFPPPARSVAAVPPAAPVALPAPRVSRPEPVTESRLPAPAATPARPPALPSSQRRHEEPAPVRRRRARPEAMAERPAALVPEVVAAAPLPARSGDVHRAAEPHVPVAPPAAHPVAPVRPPPALRSAPAAQGDSAARTALQRDPSASAAAPIVTARSRVEPPSPRNGAKTLAPPRPAADTAPSVPRALRLRSDVQPITIVPRVARAVLEPPARVRSVPAETTVHVSIGRIEVRATPEAGERRRESKPAPVMSLGDYLSSRNARR